MTSTLKKVGKISQYKYVPVLLVVFFVLLEIVLVKYGPTWSREYLGFNFLLDHLGGFNKVVEEILDIVADAFLPVISFVVLVLIEIDFMYNRRKKEVTFGTKAFNDKIKAFAFTEKEEEVLKELVLASKFENMDAVLNSSGLFETAVSGYYRIQDVSHVPAEKLEAVASLRRKMDFTGSNPLSMVCSTRQFNVGDRVDLEFVDSGQMFKRCQILEISEKTWSVKIDVSSTFAKSIVGSHALVRWTRMNDAVYSKTLTVFSASTDKVVFTHSDSLDKEQLRKWVRQVVDFPVTATFPNGEVHSGVLYDLSAGGILLGLTEDCRPDQQFSISFELPTFGTQNVDVRVLNNLGHRNPSYPLYNSISAVFTGEYAWTQERVLQFIFESTRKSNSKKMESNGETAKV